LSLLPQYTPDFEIKHPMPQLLLIPGLASNTVMWQQQLAVLPANLKPAVTDVHFRHDTIGTMAAALLEEHAGDLILCGASMGGMLAMEVARRAPDRVKALALLGTNARPETPEMFALREAAIKFFEQGRAREILQVNLPLAFHPSRAGDVQLTQTYLDFVLAAGQDQLVRQNRALMSRPDARTHLPMLNCPVLVMCGDSDQLTPPECSREIAALIPGAKLVMVAQCGHMLTMERPGEVNAALLGWLRLLN
jgi:pimeloyl-ACP methyl ester carboxylesterase